MILRLSWVENYVWRNPSRCSDRYAQIRQVPCPDRCGQFIGWVLHLLSGVLGLCTVLLRRQNFGLGQAQHVTCVVPAWVIKNCFLARLKHRAKKGFFTWNGAVFSTKIYCLNTKMHTKGCFGHNRKSVCGDFFTLTIELAKYGYFSQSKKHFLIQFFGKTKAFT